MIIGIDHIAIAVPDLKQAIKRFCDDLGLTLKNTEIVPEAKAETAFLPVEQTQIELVQPLNNQGVLQKFIKQRKGGLHHICFLSDNLEQDYTRLKNKGYEFLSEKPQPGAHNKQVMWIHPRSTDGLLIEIAERTNR